MHESPSRSRDVEALLLGGLLALVPFEARRPAVPLGPFTVTLLEAAALVVTAALLWRTRREGLAPLVPSPVRWIAFLAVAHLLAGVLAPDHVGRGLKFALRMCVAAACAMAVARLPARSLARGLYGLVVGGVLAAVLAVAEGGGLRGLDPALGVFREQPFTVGGVRRASAASEYPNLAGAMLMYGLVTLGGLAAQARGTPLLVAAVGTLTAGLLFTYSRGALVGALAGLGLIALVQRGPVPRICLGLVAAGAVAFTATEQAFALRLSTEGVESWYGADYAPDQLHLSLRPREVTVTPVRVTNRGRLAWTRHDLFHLSYHWYHVGRRQLTDGPRTRLPHDVRPGETVVLQAEVQAPEGAGQYLLLWDMVQENTAWFSGQGVPPAIVQVSVGAGTAAVGEPPAAVPTTPIAWRPGRRALWPIALRMWRAHPWTGVGPDNFRWSYGQWAGQPSWDTRVFANNAYLETVATTGLVGLAALLGTFAASAWSAWRARATGPLALAALGLLTALAVHGLVDYVFAFTGHYLVLGLAVGIAGSLARPRPAEAQP
jgi:O-antigen ligase